MGLPLVLLEAPLALHDLAADGADGGLEGGVLHGHVAREVAPVHHLGAVGAAHHVACNNKEKKGKGTVNCLNSLQVATENQGTGTQCCSRYLGTYVPRQP